MLAKKGRESNESKELMLAVQNWENTFAKADVCLELFDAGMAIEDIALAMSKNLRDIEWYLKLAKAFPQEKRLTYIPIDLYLWAALYPNPQEILEKAWDNRWHASDLMKDFRKFKGIGYPVPISKRKIKKTPIEIALGVDEEGMTTARNLYAFLRLNLAVYSRWVTKNIEENPFAEPDVDYFSLNTDVECRNLGTRGHFARDYKLTANFAKKLAMASHSEKGEEAREYFIRVEQNAKDFANGVIHCENPYLTPTETADLILDTADRFQNNLGGICLEKMVKTALAFKGVKGLN